MADESIRYSVELTARARKQLKKMDRFDARILASWIKNNLDGCADPRVLGKGLSANHSGEWRYRVGSYRILAVIHDATIVIEIFAIGRRDTIFSRERP